MNQVMLVGRLGQDPEIRYSGGGTPFCSFSLATDASYTDREGQRQDKADWHRIVTSRGTAEACKKHIAKGSLVSIEGKMETRKYTDQQGILRYVTEVIARRVRFLDSKKTNQQSPYPEEQGGNYPGPADNYPDPSFDDVPF